MMMARRTCQLQGQLTTENVTTPVWIQSSAKANNESAGMRDSLRSLSVSMKDVDSFDVQIARNGDVVKT